MSKTFTSRPGFANTRGRGRGTQTRQVEPVNANRLGTVNREAGARPKMAQPDTEPAFGRARIDGRIETGSRPEIEDQKSSEERRLTYQGGYSVIAPNEKRRQAINQIAQKESQAYKAHKQQNTPTSFNYVGTAGGGQTEAAARRKLMQESPTKTQKLLQKDQRKTYFKQKEEEELQKKKDEQRKKAQQNERRKKEEELASEHRWDNQRRVANEAFLRRLENKSKRRPEECSDIKETQSSSTSSAPVERLQPLGAAGLSSAVAKETPSNSAGMMTRQYSVEGRQLEPAERQRVDQLSVVFPQYNRTELLEILRQVNFSLDEAVAIL